MVILALNKLFMGGMAGSLMTPRQRRWDTHQEHVWCNLELEESKVPKVVRFAKMQCKKCLWKIQTIKNSSNLQRLQFLLRYNY